eukprot:15070451-Alexandrium_andersonii.AAC.1
MPGHADGGEVELAGRDGEAVERFPPGKLEVCREGGSDEFPLRKADVQFVDAPVGRPEGAGASSDPQDPARGQ